MIITIVTLDNLIGSFLMESKLCQAEIRIIHFKCCTSVGQTEGIAPVGMVCHGLEKYDEQAVEQQVSFLSAQLALGA